MTRIELVTSSLPRKRSTPELHWRSFFLSGRRGSNPRPLAWKANALPTELLPLLKKCVGKDGFEPPKSKTADLQSAPFGHSGICPKKNRADGGNRTHDPEITNHVLWPTELHRHAPFYLTLVSKGIAKIEINSKSPKLLSLFFVFFYFSSIL